VNEERPNIEIVKALIKKHGGRHGSYIKQCQEAERYYRNENDILRTGVQKKDTDPMRNADNRIPRNFHGLLVNQKASYMFTAPPLFDIGNGKKEANKKIADILGDEYAKTCKDLCVKASNSACAWLHYWKDDDNQFNYGLVESEQIIPVFSACLKRKLIAVMRTYKDIDFQTGKEITVWEYWDKEYCYSYYKKSDSISAAGLMPYNQFGISEEVDGEYDNALKHDWGRVPFIPFNNNNINTNDLKNIKPLIDAYDKVYSGFLNDLEDVQEIIYVLTNYGGTDLKEFLQDLKKYKAIKVDDDGDGGKGGVETLAINIPVEAREKFLELTRKAIFEQGQGVDPDPQRFGNTSGEALKYLYSLLELKAGLMETEFKLSFGELVRVICQYLGVDCGQITQTWTRTAISNDKELAEICNKSVGVVSNKSILKAHPLVENADDEEKQIQEEKNKAALEADDYVIAFAQRKEKEAGDGDVEDEEK